MNADQLHALPGAWWRVPEEETDGKTVYRREGTPLPPARGRDGFTLQADGQAMLHGSSPADRRTSVVSRWKVDAEGRLHVDGVSHLPRMVIDVNGDRLTLA